MTLIIYLKSPVLNFAEYSYINEVNSSILTTTAAGLDTQKVLGQLAIYNQKSAQLGALQKECDDLSTGQKG